MRHETVSQMFQRYYQDKAKGVKHTPLHTLQECCEEADIHPSVFGRWAAQYPAAPQPVITSARNVGRGAVRYYRKHEFVQWVNHIRQQQAQRNQPKEKIMPDLKSELTKVINSWDNSTQAASKPEPTPAPKTGARPMFEPTNNVCRATFAFIQSNPGKNRRELATLLEAQGYKRSSTTSLMGQMVTQGLVRDTGGLLFTIAPEYRPIKSYKSFKNQQEKEAVKPAPAPAPAPKPERKQVTLVSKRTGEVLNPKPVQPGQTAPQINSAWDADTMLNSLSIVQARALYDALRKIFGG